MVQDQFFPWHESGSIEVGDTHTVICFSHLRWNFVFQRPQHLMSRFAARSRVLFWEEPCHIAGLEQPGLHVETCAATGMTVITPQLPEGDRGGDRERLKALLDLLLAGEEGPFVRWYYTPMMLPFSDHVMADCIVYDCMDELANFKGAPPELLPLEQRLLSQADLVFTGGYSLYEAKKDRHGHVYPFPSSVDAAHFAKARSSQPGRHGGRPRLGFYGVVDERMDVELLAMLADARPDWDVEIVGPVVKIGEADLPRRDNLHFTGGRSYEELPACVAGWDVALMPFAINDATRFISPTKTPEYLAAGRPVVSTPIADVVRQYGQIEAVRVAEPGDAFIRACDEALALSASGGSWLAEADKMLAGMSWDRSFQQMSRLIRDAMSRGVHSHPIVSPTNWKSEGPHHYDVMVVGAGFAGAVMAERLAADGDKKVLLVDRRSHIGGNAYDEMDGAGVLIHRYGPHIFHTNSQEIFDYLSRFTQWRPYEHRVLAAVGDLLVPMPINRTTLNSLYGLNLRTEEEAAAFLTAQAEPVAVVRTSEDVVISAIGRTLYETFFRDYTRKQWGLDPSELDKAVTARVPTRTNVDDRYFTDRFQAMPLEGYTRMFERMLDHPNIDVLLGVDYCEARDAYPHDHLVFTGPIDEYFGYRFGKLPYRSLDFRHVSLDVDRFQPVAVVNYPAPGVPYTRITEYKHLTGQKVAGTSITYEYPAAEGDPYYPIPRSENQQLFKRYEALAMVQSDVTFVGRLATYRYYNMDQVVGQALATYRRMAKAAAGPVAPAAPSRPLAQPLSSAG
ncbi:UDP-galactopyranose mutase [Sphingobium chlorophenolicum]|uniref:UDP-galactopyranose mutase n=2 Tax=Sphingobium chlorophenolicum TaxID=46429 RepID=A0A081RB56_SPHCR|nr:UDP-galactopyranose mutase [Sphingobium chlorophenolicum]